MLAPLARCLQAALLAALLGLTLTAAQPGSAQTPAEPVTAFAAASLKDALDDVVAAYQAKTGEPIAVSYAASSALAKQIEQGAPADLFVSADLDWMEYLAARDLIDPASRHTLLGNRLVLIAPGGEAVEAMIEQGFPLAALLGDGLLAVADIDAVPAGRYAKAALLSLGVFDSVSDKLARTENVRAALALVARGEVPLGIVYATDAAAEPKVAVVDIFPEGSHPPILYPVALTANAEPKEKAKAFLDFLLSKEAAGIFEAKGFKVVAEGT